ncbi:hypothetical protein MACH17_30460 [Phaeobacter inhibens]|uniref:hypothetical protein n=1 Tax=Phaeobacter inhibens TaxID=221822 RepID=UPI00276180F0|nr:hypothetical protein [Phaeobacter inhibens]GLO71529.1 hypothetical protein MACH17_30460 [Phaeobacter inhibens]
MQVTGPGNVSVYRMLNGHANGQAAAQQAQAQQTGELIGGLETAASLAKTANVVSQQAAVTGPSEGASLMGGTQYLRTVVQQKLQDLQSGCHAGPLPASEVIAQNQYRAAQQVIG